MAQLRFFASARAAVGAERLAVADLGLPEVVDTSVLRASLAKTFPHANTLLHTCTFLVDGERIGDRQLVLAELDTIDVLPPFAGG